MQRSHYYVLIIGLCAFLAVLAMVPPFPGSGAAIDSSKEGFRAAPPAFAPDESSASSSPEPTKPTTTTSGGTMTPEPTTETAQLIVAARTYSVTLRGEPTVIDLMMTAQRENGFTYTAREYSGLGAFVDTIGGVRAPEGYSWILVVNGATSTLGASSVKVHEHDRIEWKLDKNH